jgi:hypothetical protein
VPNKPLNAKDSDISTGLAIIIQSLIVQLMDAKRLSVAQSEHVFDVALKRAKQSSPEAQRVVQYVHDTLPLDELYMASARRKKPKK